MALVHGVIEAFQLSLVQVKCIRPYIYEDGTGAAQHESVNRRGEGERGYNYLVARFDVEE